MIEEDFMEDTPFTFAVVLRAKYQKIKEIKKYLAELEGVQPVYQKWSLEPLYIRQIPSGTTIPEGRNE